MWKGGEILVRRPPVYFDPLVHPEWLPLRLSAVPLLYLAFAGDLDALVHHMRKLGEDATRQLHIARKGRPVMGAKDLRRIHPWNEPRTLREPGGDRVPTFKLGARGLTARRWEIRACRETTQFREEYSEARLNWIAGEDVELRHGTYLLRVQYGARVAKPHPEAWVAAPCPTLEEVAAELAERAREPRDRKPLLDPVREAFREEAADIVELEELDVELGRVPVVGSPVKTVLREPAKTTPQEHANRIPQEHANRIPQESLSESQATSERKVSDSQTSERPARRVRHRFARPSSEAEHAGEEGASRITVLRDRRRGRPKGTDPPG